MDNNQNVPSEYRVLSPWAYFGYNILFAIPVIGFIFAIIFAFDNSNLNRRNYARSFFCTFIIVFILVIIFIVIIGAGISTYSIMNTRIY